jgi:CBS domain-containing protein
VAPAVLRRSTGESVMPIGELAIRQVVVTSRETPVLDAAKLMRQYHVGDIVVTDETDGKRLPVGIVTDRDIVLEVLAQEVDAAKLSVGDIMTGDLITVGENEGVFQTIQLMRAKGARRAPVVDNEGVLIGIVSADDFIELLADELSELAKLISREQKREAEVRR